MQNTSSQSTTETKSSSAMIEQLPYFHGKVSVAQVHSLLSKKGDFLIQTIEQASDCKTKELIRGSLFVLSVKCDPKVRHWLIKNLDDKFGIEQAVFGSVSDMVSHHLDNQKSIVENEIVLLKNSVVRQERIKPILLDDDSSEEGQQENVKPAKVPSVELTEKLSFELADTDLGHSCDDTKVSEDKLTSASVIRSVGLTSSDDGGSIAALHGSKSDESAAVSANVWRPKSCPAVRKYPSAPLQTSWLNKNSLTDLKSDESRISSSHIVDDNSWTKASVDNNTSSTATWPSLHLFNSSETNNSSLGQKSSVSPLNTDTHPFSSSLGNRVIGKERSKPSKVSFLLPSEISSLPNLAGSPSLDYDSVDKFALRYAIAKASSFYEFVQLYSASKKDVPTISALIRMAELLFKDYQQQALDEVHHWSSA